MKEITYDFLGQHPEHIPLIAQWHQGEWQHISPHLTTELRIQQYSAYPDRASIPCCIVASQNGHVLGSASLVASDMETRSELGPWLASVYVHPNFRRRGIATHLIEQCLDAARECRVDRLYLFTPDQAAFYQQRGWKLLEHCVFHGEQVDIMFYELN